MLILFLGVLIFSNYNSIRVLHHSIQFLDQFLQEQSVTILSRISADLTNHPWTEDPYDTRLQGFLEECVQKYGLKGIVLYKSDDRPRASVLGDAPPEFSDPKQLLGMQKFLRRDSRLLVAGSYREGPMSLPVVLIMDARRVFQIERTTKIVSYTNVLLMIFAALMVIYFFESAFRPYRLLVQTARSATLAAPAVEHANEADFLISTFNGVISRLKTKEQELEKLHQSEKARADDVQQLNQDLVRSISSGLILVDDRESVRVFNQAAETILELNRAAVVNRPYRQGLCGGASAFCDDIARCLRERTHLERAEMEIRTAGGKQQFLNASVMPVQDRMQNFAGVLCLFSDITDFKRLQQHMAQKEKYASLGEMAGGVAHEFRNSLATVTGYVQMLETRIGPAKAEYIAPIHTELQSLQKVINDFLSFARPVQLEMRPVDLRELLEDCSEEVRVSAPADVEFTMRGEFHGLNGDEAMLRQVFLNLIRNAAESLEGSGRTGSVVISGSRINSDGMVTVEVQDNGGGIRDEDLPKIFTPFFTTKRDGVGLGLAIVKKLVLQHNGMISVESSPKGSVFRVQLPAAG